VGSLFVLSLWQRDDAAQGQIKMNRISFPSDSHSYTFLTAEPVARDKQVWILRNQRYKPAKEIQKSGMIGTSTVKELLRLAATK